MTENKRCPLYKKCGGCQLQNLDYERQLSLKYKRVIGLVGRFGRVSRIIGMDNPYHYRNKVQAAFGTDRSGHIISGVYQSSTHRIVPVEECLIEDKIADSIIGTVRALLRSFKLRPYNEDTGEGFLRHVLVKRGFVSGQVMVVLVTGSGEFKSRRSFVNALVGRHPEIVTVVRNINDRHTSLVLGERSEILYGSGKIEEQLCGFTFRISPKAFYQINPVQTEVLYGLVRQFAELKPTDTVLDAYCGTGTIGLILSQDAGQVIGVEINADAVRDAKENAEINGIKNAKFYTADAGEYLVAAAERGDRVDAVIMDPPRAGSSRAFLKSLIKMSPQRVVYVSCNPLTLARDLEYICRGGYDVKKIQPVDMFPHTEHVECAVLLTRRAK